MKWTNKQFGEMEFEEKHVVYFPEGLIGFEECKKYLIVNDESSEPFRWLVSLEDEEVAFPILDPELVVEGYSQKYLFSNNETLFTVVSIKSDMALSTVNLRSPLVIDSTDRNGKQIVLDAEDLQVRTPLSQLAATIAE
jgi:flagellar assembly factor FliW